MAKLFRLRLDNMHDRGGDNQSINTPVKGKLPSPQILRGQKVEHDKGKNRWD